MTVNLADLPKSVRDQIQKKTGIKPVKSFSGKNKQRAKAVAATRGATARNIRKKDSSTISKTTLPDWLKNVLKSDSLALVAAKLKKSDNPHEAALAELISDPTEYKGNQEHYLQTALFYRLCVEFPVIYEMSYATPNGGLRDNTTAMKMKREGQKSGYPDLCIDIPTYEFHGFKLEVKREESVSSVSDNQLSWQKKHTFFNYKTSVEFDYEACWNAIFCYITMIYKERPNLDAEYKEHFS